jgi:hypothetical protein
LAGQSVATDLFNEFTFLIVWFYCKRDTLQTTVARSTPRPQNWSAWIADGSWLKAFYILGLIQIDEIRFKEVSWLVMMLCGQPSLDDSSGWSKLVVCGA